tara:strand:- start:2583 stop:3878 length:1296 start_codon:yes stop_codon:yes gene_type:complete
MLSLLFYLLILYTIFVFINSNTTRKISNSNLSINYVVNNKIDAYLYINLKNRKDRKTEIENEFKKLNLDKSKIFRIDAVYDKWNGHIGCVKSHIKALEFAKTKKFKNIIVFEDDFIFTKNKNYINNCINSIDFEWDVVQLSSSYKKTQKYNNNFEKAIWIMSSSGYIINNNFYDKLLENFRESLEKMEKEMKTYDYSKGKKKETNNALDQHWGSLQKNSKWYIFEPPIGKQSSSSSSIMNNVEGNKLLDEKQIKFNNVLNDMANILEKNNVKFLLYCGTALGVYRDNRFIDWDHDIDLAIFEDEIDMNKIYNIISKSDKFNYFKHYPKNKEIKDSTEITFKHKDYGVRLDILQIIKTNTREYEHYTYTGVCDDRKDKKCIYKYPKFKINNINFLGRNYNIPDITFIESQYGINWKTPEKYNYDPNKNSSLQ